MHSRRTFLGRLAALPFVGVLFGRKVEAAPDELPGVTAWSNVTNAKPIASLKEIEQSIANSSDFAHGRWTVSTNQEVIRLLTSINQKLDELLNG